MSWKKRWAIIGVLAAFQVGLVTCYQSFLRASDPGEKTTTPLAQIRATSESTADDKLVAAFSTQEPPKVQEVEEVLPPTEKPAPGGAVVVEDREPPLAAPTPGEPLKPAAVEDKKPGPVEPAPMPAVSSTVLPPEPTKVSGPIPLEVGPSQPPAPASAVAPVKAETPVSDPPVVVPAIPDSIKPVEGKPSTPPPPVVYVQPVPAPGPGNADLAKPSDVKPPTPLPISRQAFPPPPPTPQQTLPSDNNLIPPAGAKPEAPVGTCPWALRVEIIDGRTMLTASHGKVIQFQINCEKLSLQTPRGVIDAQGNVKLYSEGLDGQCDRLTIAWREDHVILEGQAQVKCHRDGQEVELKSERLSLRLAVATKPGEPRRTSLEPAARPQPEPRDIQVRPVSGIQSQGAVPPPQGFPQ